MRVQVVPTAAGPVQIAVVEGDLAPVLFFPGGHCTAACDCGWELYTSSGHGIVSFSRPGYGATRVGPLTAAQFAPVVTDVCDHLRVTEVAAVVGVSFGGMQAVTVASQEQLVVPRLVLHSCAPSERSYPDTRAEMIGGQIAFSPFLEGLTWSAVRGVISTDTGLRHMMARLSTLPSRQWWPHLSPGDKESARRLFRRMRSGAGFAHDLRQARASTSVSRRALLNAVSCQTLVTGSRHDRGVAFAHAESQARAIPDAALVELTSASHLFWIGPERLRAAEVVRAFLAA